MHDEEVKGGNDTTKYLKGRLFRWKKIPMQWGLSHVKYPTDDVLSRCPAPLGTEKEWTARMF